MQPQAEPLLEGIDTLARKSAQDADLRKLALTDPIAALRQVTGVEVPADARIRFVEKLDELVIVLPPLQESNELSEEGLAFIHGGHVFWTGLETLNKNRKSPEESREEQKAATPGWLRGFLDGIFG